MHRVHNLHERVPLTIRETVEFVEANELLKRRKGAIRNRKEREERSRNYLVLGQLGVVPFVPKPPFGGHEEIAEVACDTKNRGQELLDIRVREEVGIVSGMGSLRRTRQ